MFLYSFLKNETSCVNSPSREMGNGNIPCILNSTLFHFLWNCDWVILSNSYLSHLSSVNLLLYLEPGVFSITAKCPPGAQSRKLLMREGVTTMSNWIFWTPLMKRMLCNNWDFRDLHSRTEVLWLANEFETLRKICQLTISETWYDEFRRI